MDYDAARKRVRELSERYGLAVNPDARVDRITVGQQQRVEILKALYRGADILILDEPTAVLTPQEAGELFEIVRSLPRLPRRRARAHPRGQAATRARARLLVRRERRAARLRQGAGLALRLAL